MAAIQRRNFQGQRANDLLSITVGTQSISPFYWSIDSGVMDALAAMHTNQMVSMGFWNMSTCELEGHQLK